MLFNITHNSWQCLYRRQYQAARKQGKMDIQTTLNYFHVCDSLPGAIPFRSFHFFLVIVSMLQVTLLQVTQLAESLLLPLPFFFFLNFLVHLFLDWAQQKPLQIKKKKKYFIVYFSIAYCAFCLEQTKQTQRHPGMQSPLIGAKTGLTRIAMNSSLN